MADTANLETIRTKVPARLDRLPWSKFHWRIVAALGTVWILDGLEVTIVGSVAARMTEPGSGINLNAADIGYAAAIYVAGACLGALLFGQLTDRFGRKRLMIITLAVYVLATVATAFAFAPWYFFVCRFLTGMGIGGEYAAVNSAIDELIPARNRGQVDITINGSYWVGSAIGAVAALWFLNTAIFAVDLGWRLAFGMGGLLGFTILWLRKTVPESPRWLFIHGREDEAERIADRVERDVRVDTGQELPDPDEAITVRQRKVIPFREIARVAVKLYPRRSILGIALFVGQAFLYNAVTFDLGTLLSEFFGVASGAVPYFMVIFAAGNFMGPFLLGRLFDTVGRKQMITGTYLLSSVLTTVIAVLLVTGGFNRWSFIALIGVTFFFASAGASSAYLTVSEIFPMETRALAIAFFYALGTAVGGIVGPLLFGSLIGTGNAGLVAIGFVVGAVVMALGGVAELVFGIRSERVSLENLAKPLTVADAEGGGPEAEAEPSEVGKPRGAERRAAVDCRERAEEERVRASEHLSVVHRLQAEAGQDSGLERRADAERVLAEVSRLRAENLESMAVAHDEQAAADEAQDPQQRCAALDRARSARERALVAEEQAESLVTERQADADYHAKLAEAADERARANEQKALAEQARGEAADRAGAEAGLAGARADMHEAWAMMHEAWAAAHAAGAERDDSGAADAERQAGRHHERALAAEQRANAAQHRREAERMREELGEAERSERETEKAADRERAARERDERIRQRLSRRASRESKGLRRYRPGPGMTMYSPGMLGTASRWAPPNVEQALDREIAVIEQALREHGHLVRSRLAAIVGARYWGPGRFRAALDEAEYEGRIRRISRDTYALATVESTT